MTTTPSNANSNNPWKADHLAAEFVFTGGWMARATVEREFELAPAPKPCPNDPEGSQLWWKATVGAMICPDCGRMESSMGKVYRIGGNGA